MFKEYCKAEYVHRRVCFINVKVVKRLHLYHKTLGFCSLAPTPIHICEALDYSSLHENVFFSICVNMHNATYIIFIILNSISSLDAWYDFRIKISCGVAVMGRSHQTKFQIIFKGEGSKKKN